jgi:hypothetical protein
MRNHTARAAAIIGTMTLLSLGACTVNTNPPATTAVAVPTASPPQVVVQQPAAPPPASTVVVPSTY